MQRVPITRPPMLVESDYDSWKIRIHSQGLPDTERRRVIFNILNADKHFSGDLEQCRTTYARIGKELLQQRKGRFLPPTNNQLRTSSNTRAHATVHDATLLTEPVQRKAPGNVGITMCFEQEVIWFTTTARGEDILLCSVKNPRERWTLIESGYSQEEHIDSDAETENDDNYDPRLNIITS
ncbi:hypothetical protein Tco_0200655 [Tanacetum coccineum]